MRVASRIEREWLSGVVTETVHRFDEESGCARAFAVDRYERLTLAERAVPADPEVAAPLLAEALERRGPGPAAERLARRLRFAGRETDLSRVFRAACRGRTRLPALDAPERWLDTATREALDRLAPLRLALPSGRTAAVDYREDGTIHVPAKLQELFGLGETPRLGPRKVAVIFDLLAPNGRPVQTTGDLASFWRTTYPEVRKELRGRYPRHPWPEDPWSARPTSRTKRRE